MVIFLLYFHHTRHSVPEIVQKSPFSPVDLVMFAFILIPLGVAEAVSFNN